MTSKDDLIVIGTLLVVLALCWVVPRAVQSMYGF